MKNIICFILIAFIYSTASAQTIEELSSYEQTFISQLSDEQYADRFIARHGNKLSVTMILPDQPMGRSGLDIFPDTLYAREPFDVHYITDEGHEATFELYDLRGKRPKRIGWKRASKNIRGRTVVRIVIDEPGTYEVVAYDEEYLQLASDPELKKSRWTISVREPRKVRP
ncbi:hypothetical protein [Alistipes sp.]|uniref:hypothetical protein n=1 Tax=Alistipes sp. TaxID=1872444 RepID=UPI003AF15317